MQVAIYVRVSTTRQSQTQTIEQPMSRLQVENERHSDWDLLPEHVFRDDGISGATLNRPGLDRLRDGTAFARYGLVLVTAPDRLGRKYVHQVLLVEEFHQRGTPAGSKWCAIRPRKSRNHQAKLCLVYRPKAICVVVPDC